MVPKKAEEQFQDGNKFKYSKSQVKSGLKCIHQVWPCAVTTAPIVPAGLAGRLTRWQCWTSSKGTGKLSKTLYLRDRMTRGGHKLQGQFCGMFLFKMGEKSQKREMLKKRELRKKQVSGEETELWGQREHSFLLGYGNQRQGVPRRQNRCSGSSCPRSLFSQGHTSQVVLWGWWGRPW